MTEGESPVVTVPAEVDDARVVCRGDVDGAPVAADDDPLRSVDARVLPVGGGYADRDTGIAPRGIQVAREAAPVDKPPGALPPELGDGVVAAGGDVDRRAVARDREGAQVVEARVRAVRLGSGEPAAGRALRLPGDAAPVGEPAGATVSLEAKDGVVVARDAVEPALVRAQGEAAGVVEPRVVPVEVRVRNGSACARAARTARGLAGDAAPVPEPPATRVAREAGNGRVVG